MSTRPSPAQNSAMELPPGAPRVRITAGAGSPGQKTWNLRRPVTLIGSRRPASIVLHDRDISAAHCVILNTGTDVLLKDLHTSSGTFCNKEKVGLTLLKDGDVVVVADTRIQVAIQIDHEQNDDSGCGLEFADPTKFAEPVKLQLAHTDREWRIEDAVTLIGRHPAAAVRLDNEAVSIRQAILFRFGREPAIFDLSDRTGMTVNGEGHTLCQLKDGDRVGLGPCVLSVGSSDSAAANGGVQNTQESTPTESTPSREFGSNGCPSPGNGRCPNGANGKESGAEARGWSGRLGPLASIDPNEDPGTALDKIESQLADLQTNIGDSWERLNLWESQLQQDACALNKQESDLAAREAEIDAKDAALRGQLHDLSRYHEEIVARERELAKHLAVMQDREDRLKAAQAAREQQEAALASRAEELKRREHALEQRWTRLLSATCPHCGRPVNVGQTSPSGS